METKMLLHICLVWQACVVLAQESTVLTGNSSNVNPFSISPELRTSTQSPALPTEETLTTRAKLILILNIKDTFSFLPSFFRQGVLYTLDLVPSTGDAENMTRLYSGNHPSSFWALATDYRRNRIYYTDFRRNFFGTYDLKKDENTRLFEGLSFGIDGIAVDWLTGNIYWIDIDIRKIVVADPSLKYFTQLIDIDSSIPAKIALHPLLNQLYWSETGDNSSRIYRSDMSGRNVTLLHEFFDAYQIDTLYISIPESRLYWSDRTQTSRGTRASVKSIELEDPRRVTTHYITLNGTIQGLAASGNYLYISNSRNHSLISFSKTTLKSKLLGRFRESVTPYALTIFSAEAQPFALEDHEAHPCFDHSCEQICLTDGLNKHRCACQVGSKLQADGRSCGSELLTENFMLVVDDKHSKIYQVSLTDASVYTVLPISDLSTPISVDYDYETKKIYWYDLDDRVVYRSYLNGTGKEVFLESIRATFIAIEPESRNLYIVNNVIDSIEVASLDLRNKVSVLHVHDIHSAWQMVISHELKKIFWSDWGQSTVDRSSLGLIESINMDGSDRNIVVGETTSPRALTIDEQNQILYWSELGTSMIAWRNLRTNETGKASLDIELLPSISKRFNGLEFYDGHLYIADLNRPSMYRISAYDVLSAGNTAIKATPFGPSFYTVTGIKVVGQSAPSSAGASECAIDRAGCPEVCLATPGNGIQCVCEPHSVYVEENNTCTAVHDTDDEIAPSFGFSCALYRRRLLSLRTDLCSRRRIFNFTEPAATDNTGVAPTLKRSYDRPPPYNLTQGFYVFTYTARDTAGNSAVCSINAIVEPPITCSQPPNIPVGGRASEPTCENLRGSQVNVHCYGSTNPTFTYTCDITGNWGASEPPICIVPTTTTTSSPTSTTASTSETTFSSRAQGSTIASTKTAIETTSVRDGISTIIPTTAHETLSTIRASSPIADKTTASAAEVSSAAVSNITSSSTGLSEGNRNRSKGGGRGIGSGGVAAIVIVLVLVLVLAAVVLVRRYRSAWLTGVIFWRKKDDRIQLTEDFDEVEPNIYKY